jgi:hypothetical protein
MTGRLLLREGAVIASKNQLNALLQRGMYRQRTHQDNVPAHHVTRPRTEVKSIYRHERLIEAVADLIEIHSSRPGGKCQATRGKDMH